MITRATTQDPARERLGEGKKGSGEGDMTGMGCDGMGMSLA
jgi:hypothetical protein